MTRPQGVFVHNNHIITITPSHQHGAHWRVYLLDARTEMNDPPTSSHAMRMAQQAITGQLVIVKSVDS